MVPGHYKIVVLENRWNLEWAKLATGKSKAGAASTVVVVPSSKQTVKSGFRSTIGTTVAAFHRNRWQHNHWTGWSNRRNQHVPHRRALGHVVTPIALTDTLSFPFALTDSLCFKRGLPAGETCTDPKGITSAAVTFYASIL